jgi:hypothetical protein
MHDLEIARELLTKTLAWEYRLHFLGVLQHLLVRQSKNLRSQ